MERFVKGDVVVLPFPFSDLSASKRRPALIVASLEGDDLILAQITNVERFDSYVLSLVDKDFVLGKLPHESNVRPNKLFTADKSIIVYKAGQVKKTKQREVEDALVKILTKTT